MSSALPKRAAAGRVLLEAVEECEREGHPECQHRQIEAVFDGTRHSDLRES
jgi:hypothetical protein